MRICDMDEFHVHPPAASSGSDEPSDLKEFFRILLIVEVLRNLSKVEAARPRWVSAMWMRVIFDFYVGVCGI